MLRDRLAADVRGTDGRVCGKRDFLKFVAFYVRSWHNTPSPYPLFSPA